MEKINKVLFVSSLYFPVMGGIQTSIDSYCKELNKRGIETAVLTKKYPPELTDSDIHDNTYIMRVVKPETDTDYLNVLKQIISENKIHTDIIHVIGVRRPLPLFALLLSRYLSVPCLMTFAGSDVPNGLIQEEMAVWEERKIDTINSIKQADGYSAYSTGIAKCAQSLMPFLNEIPIFKTGIDLDMIEKVKPYHDSCDYILTARRFVYSKGIDILLRAFAIVKDKFPKLQLYIAGYGEEQDHLEQLVSSLNLNSRVRFLGTIPLKELYAYMKGAKAHICPSRTEGGGNVNIEASACGCIPIGSRVGGIPEYILDKKTGFLFESENIYELADCICRVMAFGDDILRMKQNGMSYAQEFSIASLTNRYLELYRSLKMRSNFEPWSTLTKEMWNEIHS